MSSEKMATIPKPVLRGFLAKNIKFHLCGAVVTSCFCGYLMKVLYCDPKKVRHDEFYKTYDPKAKLKIMMDAGLMQADPNFTR